MSEYLQDKVHDALASRDFDQPFADKLNLVNVYMTLRDITSDGEWTVGIMSDNEVGAEEFAVFGSNIEAMVTLSTVEHGGEIGRWRIC